jgi:hypothetical protein
MEAYLNVSNKDQFSDFLYKEHLSILRKEVSYMMLQRNESDFYDIDAFNRKYVKNMNKTKEMVEKVVNELKELGWNTFIGYGGTGLYVYSDKKPPGTDYENF